MFEYKKSLNTKYVLLFLFVFSYIVSEVFSWFLLETDSYTQDLFASSLSDGIAWTDSARNKFLYGYWYHEVLDDWRPIFIIPIHQILTWVGYETFGLTLTGHRFFPFLFIHLSKILILYIILKEFGIRYFLFSIIFLSVYPPLNELGRIGTMDSAQVGLYIISAFIYYISLFYRSIIWKLLAGVLIAITVLYKISGLVFLTFPIIFVLLSSGFGNLWKEIVSIKSDLYLYVLGIIIVILPYMLFWQIPNLDETVYFSIRMFGVTAGIASVSNYMLILQRFISLFSSESFNEYIVGYQSWWVIGYLLFLIGISLLPRKRIKKIDYLLVAVFLIFVVQIIFFDMALRRYIGLIPFGVIALVRAVNILFNYNKYGKEAERSYFNAILFSYSLYLLISFSLSSFVDFKIDFLYFFAIITLFIVLYFKICSSSFCKYGYYLLFLLLLLYIPENYFYMNQYFSKISYGMKDASIEMGKKLGTARVIEAHEYSLYNKTKNSYLGSHAGQYKPDGWVYDDEKKQTLKEFAEQEYSHNFWALKLKVFNWLYPGFLDRWYLPKNYESVYHSNLFASYDQFYTDGHNYDLYLYTHYAKRHLVIGMNEPLVYVPDGVSFTNASGKKVALKYDREKSVKIKLPDVKKNHYWYGMTIKDTGVSYMTFNLREH